MPLPTVIRGRGRVRGEAVVGFPLLKGRLRLTSRIDAISKSAAARQADWIRPVAERTCGVKFLAAGVR